MKLVGSTGAGFLLGGERRGFGAVMSSDNVLTCTLRWGWATDTNALRLEGLAGSLVSNVIESALDREPSDFLYVLYLAPREQAEDQTVRDFVFVPADMTMDDFAAFVGPEPERVHLVPGGFAPPHGDLLGARTWWTIAGLRTAGRDLLAELGAPALARRLGAASRFERSSDLRRLAGDDPIPGPLELAIRSLDEWSMEDVELFFGLDPASARPFMRRHGYVWDDRRAAFVPKPPH